MNHCLLQDVLRIDTRRQSPIEPNGNHPAQPIMVPDQQMMHGQNVSCMCLVEQLSVTLVTHDRTRLRIEG
jgi:hypothetical protein